LLQFHFDVLERELKLKNQKAILFVEGALIVEAGSYKLFDEVWMTVASREEIERRFLKRLEDSQINEYSKATLDKILNNQMRSEEKAKYCSEVIDTSDEIEKTYSKYSDLYKKLANKLGISY